MATQGQSSERALLLSYLALRRAVGVLAMALPFGLLPLSDPELPSVSAGYYGQGGALFVAAVCVIGVFLLFYRGYDGRDRKASFVAGIAALVVGLVPCGLDRLAVNLPVWGWSPSYADSIWPYVHWAAAALLFAVLALFCLWLFPMSNEPGRRNPRKVWRNRVYRACGGVIVICLLGLGIDHVVAAVWLPPGSVFWLETAMLIAFGLSWAVKGEAFAVLNDRSPARRTPDLPPTATKEPA